MMNLTADAVAYFRSLPDSARAALEHSNLTFRTVEDLKSYLEYNPIRASEVLYQQLPEPAIPSNAALDPLDSADP